jgi:hypothetical protein
MMGMRSELVEEGCDWKGMGMGKDGVGVERDGMGWNGEWMMLMSLTMTMIRMGGRAVNSGLVVVVDLRNSDGNWVEREVMLLGNTVEAKQAVASQRGAERSGLGFGLVVFLSYLWPCLYFMGCLSVQSGGCRRTGRLAF